MHSLAVRDPRRLTPPTPSPFSPTLANKAPVARGRRHRRQYYVVNIWDIFRLDYFGIVNTEIHQLANKGSGSGGRPLRESIYLNDIFMQLF